MLIEFIKRKKELEEIIKNIEIAFHQHAGRLMEVEDLIKKLENQNATEPSAPKGDGK